MFNLSEFHFFGSISYEIHILEGGAACYGNISCRVLSLGIGVYKILSTISKKNLWIIKIIRLFSKCTIRSPNFMIFNDFNPYKPIKLFTLIPKLETIQLITLKEHSAVNAQELRG